MATIRNTIEYLAYIIENDVPEDQYFDLLKEKGIIVNEPSLHLIFTLRNDYKKILKIYNNNPQQFMKALKASVLFNTEQNFINFPYKEFLKNFYDNFLLVTKSFLSRPQTIKYNLQLQNIDNLVVKYDYYFYNRQFVDLKLDLEDEGVEDLHSVKSQNKEYVLAITSNKKVIIYDYKTSKQFNLPEQSLNPPIALLSSFNGKFIVGMGQDMYILDFVTQEQTVKHLDIEGNIMHLKLLSSRKIIVAGVFQCLILNTDFEIENTINTFASQLVILPDSKIATLDTNINRISFWDPSRIDSLIETIDLQKRKHPLILKNIDHRIIVGLEMGEIQLFDDINLMRTIDLHNNSLLYDIIVQSSNFIVLFDGFICLFDYDGNLINEIPVEEAQRIFSLPDNRVVVSVDEGARIYNLTQRVGDEEELPENYILTVSPSGKIILVTLESNLVVYE